MSPQEVDAFVVPTETGAAFFVDSNHAELDASDGPIQLATYSPHEVSAGEAAVVRARFGDDLFSFAVSAAGFGHAWRRKTVIALLEFVILALLVTFLVVNRSPIAWMIGWALPFGFLVATRSALHAVAHRKVGERARCMLTSGLVLIDPATAQFGGSLAHVRDIWRGLENGTIARDTVAPELACAGRLR